jgi:hypothetical protein
LFNDKGVEATQNKATKHNERQKRLAQDRVKRDLDGYINVILPALMVETMNRALKSYALDHDGVATAPVPIRIVAEIRLHADTRTRVINKMNDSVRNTKFVAELVQTYNGMALMVTRT